MSSEKNTPKQESDNKPGIDRRNMLKALAGVPVLGAFGWQVLRKSNLEKKNNLRQEIVNELGLNDLMDSVKPIQESNGDLVRIGIVGFGVRGTQDAEALGYVAKSRYDANPGMAQDANFKYGNFNVAITGICDVFDLHAEKGMEAASFDLHSKGEFAVKHPAKRYKHYHDMLADPNIDAVIITTPDHHHAQMTIDAVKAGKHVYCEKSFIHREEEVYAVYDAVKNSNLVFQVGHQIPQNAVFQQAKEIIQRGLLGNISHVETTSNRNSNDGAWIRHLDSKGNPKPGDENSINWKEWLGKAPEAPFSIERYYGWARFFDYDTGLFGQLFSHEYDAINQLLHIGIPDTVDSLGGQYYYKDFGQIPDVLQTTFNYPDKGLTMVYSANLTNSKNRPRTIYGKDASLTVGGHLALTPDGQSEQYADLLKQGLINPNKPMLEILKGQSLNSAVDAVSSATTSYYANRGLTSTNVDGREWDVTHLHLKEWIDCIRNGGTTSANIDMAFVEGITIAMADISYRENCRTKWDAENKRILRV
ncbi:Gfo/Idh/MocA family protein [Bacteroidota bacterium]